MKFDLCLHNLRWLEPVSSIFQDVHYDHYILVDAKLMVSKPCQIIAEYGAAQ